ncbi:MAG: isoprenyl transferase [Armatimonadetes bacterium]|nr:isoprenyl transferase [Armatimonadota bacterium]
MSLAPSSTPALSPEDELIARLDPERLPRHIGIIMDGNGRWARKRGRPRIFGHYEGHKTVRQIVELCRDLGIEVLTLYTFSSENWRRPQDEVFGLMQLIERVARMETPELHRNKVRIRAIGRLEELPPSLRTELDKDMELTRQNTGLQLNLAINYGGRAEIIDAVRALVREGVSPETIDEAALNARLTTAGQPDPDLIIRTGGDARLSNFLLWQAAYAEIVVTDALWPEFSKVELLTSILDFQSRTRKFGGVV